MVVEVMVIVEVMAMVAAVMALYQSLVSGPPLDCCHPVLVASCCEHVVASLHSLSCMNKPSGGFHQGAFSLPAQLSRYDPLQSTLSALA